MHPFRSLLAVLMLGSLCGKSIQAQSTGAGAVTNQVVASVQTVAYCDILQHSDKFKNKMVRVQAVYETDFEKSVINSPACPAPFPMRLWVEFDERWESRTPRKVRKKVSNLKWRVPLDVVFVGKIKTDGKYGHMDMYPIEIEVYKVEAATTRKNAMPHSGPG